MQAGRNWSHRGRQLKDLATLATLNWRVSQTTLTVRALLNPMHLDIIRVGPHRQRMSLAPGLSPAWLTTRLAQTPWRRFLIPVTRRRFATVAAVLGHLVFQCRAPHCQRLDSLLLLLHDADPIFPNAAIKAATASSP
jgi:hypothetical protein